MDLRYEKLHQEVSALKKELKQLRDEQIKQRRDNNDIMYNLDEDNVPSLAGIVKRVDLIVNGDGTANARFLIEAINGQSEATLSADVITLEGNSVIQAINDGNGKVLIQADKISLDGDTIIKSINNDGTGVVAIQADRIALDGYTIVLNGEKGITVTSPNFSLSSSGVMTCKGATITVAVIESAKIKKTCVLGSDISEGEGIQVGPALDNDYGGGSVVKIYPFITSGFAYGDETRGIEIKSGYEAGTKDEDFPYYSGSLIIDVGKVGASASEDGAKSAFAGVEREFQNKKAFPALWRKDADGNTAAVWIDENGNLCTTATAVMVRQEYPSVHDE